MCIKKDNQINEHQEYIDKWVGYETEIYKVIEFVGYYKRNNQKYPRRWFKYECKFCENTEICGIHRLSTLGNKCPICKCVYKKKENLKLCAGCLEWKLYTKDNFNIFPSTTKNGKRLQPECRPCRLKTSKKTRDRRAENGKEKEYRDSIKPNVNVRRKERYDNDYVFKISVNIRNSINQAFKIHSFKSNSKARELLDCDWDAFKKHLESQFTEGMTWELMGKEIHIDHIIPLSSAQTKEELEKLCHYTNLQPLWAKYNLMKNGKILSEEELNKLKSLPRPE